jgi:ribosome-binding protein aMBF1 (putative translation factor)
VVLLEARVEQETFVVSEEELERCRMCGKMFKPYKIKARGQELDSAICKECREKST